MEFPEHLPRYFVIAIILYVLVLGIGVDFIAKLVSFNIFESDALFAYFSLIIILLPLALFAIYMKFLTNSYMRFAITAIVIFDAVYLILFIMPFS
jgi:hypothetical protein